MTFPFAWFDLKKWLATCMGSIKHALMKVHSIMGRILFGHVKWAKVLQLILKMNKVGL